jgi:hypothetical protein
MTQTDLEDKLDGVMGWISNCDQKASILLAFIGVAFPLLFSSDFATNTYKELISDFLYYLQNREGQFSLIRFLCLFFTILSILGLGVSFWFLLSALSGRIDSSIYAEDGLRTESLIFFGSISKMRYIDFQTNFSKQSKDTAINDLTSQLYINSKICQTKFAAYNNALCWLKLGILFLLAAFILLLFI